MNSSGGPAGASEALVPIGDAASRLGVAPSVLRYYDDRGLVRATERRGGRRWYGPTEMRALAFLRIAAELGLPLGTAAELLTAESHRWRDLVGEQIDELERLVTRARATRDFLQHSLDCPAPRPVRDCPTLTGTLDRIAAGASVDRTVAEASPDRPGRRT